MAKEAGGGKKTQVPSEPLRKRHEWDQTERKKQINESVPGRQPGGGDDTQGFGPRIDNDPKKGT